MGLRSQSLHLKRKEMEPPWGGGEADHKHEGSHPPVLESPGLEGVKCGCHVGVILWGGEEEEGDRDPGTLQDPGMLSHILVSVFQTP